MAVFLHTGRGKGNPITGDEVDSSDKLFVKKTRRFAMASGCDPITGEQHQHVVLQEPDHPSTYTEHGAKGSMAQDPRDNRGRKQRGINSE